MRLFTLRRSDATHAHGRESSLACEERDDAEDAAVEKDLSELEVDPVPNEQDLKGAKAADEGQDGRREEVRDAREYLTPLCGFNCLRTKSEEAAYQGEEHSPRCESDTGKEGRDGARGQFLRCAECVHDLWEQVEGRLVGVLRRWLGFREDHVKELDFEGRVRGGTDDERYLQR